MEISGKLSEDQVKAIVRFLRSKAYWPKMLLTNLPGLAIAVAVLVLTFQAITTGDRTHAALIITSWLLFGGLFFGYYKMQTKNRRKALEDMNFGLPDLIVLNSEGVQTRNSLGVFTSRPWSSFKGWRNVGPVVLLDTIEAGFLIIPQSTLSTVDSEALKGILKSFLGENLGLPV